MQVEIYHNGETLLVEVSIEERANIDELDSEFSIYSVLDEDGENITDYFTEEEIRYSVRKTLKSKILGAEDNFYL